jgi:hypothetical protein
MHRAEYYLSTRKPERYRAGEAALIEHLTCILNIRGRKTDKIMSNNLMFSPLNLMDGHQTVVENLGKR